MASNKPAPKVFDLKPQPTVAKAVAASAAHVNAVNKSSKQSPTK